MQLSLFSNSMSARKSSIFRRFRIPFYYEPEIPADYTEHGCEKGAKIENTVVENRDILRIFTTTKQMNLEDSLAWIDTHEAEFDASTVIIDTDDGNSLLQYRERKPQVFISKRHLNRIRHLNTLLNRANEELAQGGYLWSHCRTAILKRKLILEKYPAGINWVIYLLHYFWHRFCAKMPLLKRIYFAVTKGKSRTYNRVEVLGRMYRAGFEVVDEEFRYGEFFVLARKIKAPIWNDTPTGSPLIKLKRVGKGGKLIGVYKFRTMYSYSEYLQPYIYQHNKLDKSGKFADDYRVNLWGKVFRKLWIDEIPMIFNLFLGNMKLVGVRPLSPHFFSLYPKEIQVLRTRCLPGLLPPGIAEKEPPEGLEAIVESERKYLEAYFKSPIKTDCIYLWKIIKNILFKGRRSQ